MAETHKPGLNNRSFKSRASKTGPQVSIFKWRVFNVGTLNIGPQMSIRLNWPKIEKTLILNQSIKFSMFCFNHCHTRKFGFFRLTFTIFILGSLKQMHFAAKNWALGINTKILILPTLNPHQVLQIVWKIRKYETTNLKPPISIGLSTVVVWERKSLTPILWNYWVVSWKTWLRRAGSSRLCLKNTQI